MQGDKLVMSGKERQRKVILESVLGGYLTLKEASERMKISYRQAKRIYRRYVSEGDVGLVHKLRGERPCCAFSVEFKEAALSCYKMRYEGFGPTLAAEKLVEDGYVLNHETLRLWLKEAGILAPSRKRLPYRKQRKRRERFGDLLQLDGSFHAWFGEGYPTACLMDLVDDATGTTLALLDEQETTYAAMVLLEKWILHYGVPKEIYVDLKTVYVSPKSRKGDEQEISAAFTHFSKACEKLGIRIIKAYSPQAKGRVERKHRVFQDRFVKELGLRGIKDITSANALLDNGFIEQLNKKFAKPPFDEKDAHRSRKDYGDLEQIFCWEYQRQVQNDWTIRFNNHCYQLHKSAKMAVRPKHKITVREHLDNSLSLWHKETRLSFEEISCQPKQKIYEKKGYDLSLRIKNAKQYKHKSPWSQFNPGWLKNKPYSKIGQNVSLK
jgi:transposase